MIAFTLTYVVFAGQTPSDDFAVKVIEVDATSQTEAVGTVNQLLSAGYLKGRNGGYCLMEVAIDGSLVDLVTDLDDLQAIINFATV